VNVGLISYNFNYERNIFQFPKSYTNIRIGYGKWNDWQNRGTGYIATLVHLIGQQNSHLELNLGLRHRIGEREDVDIPYFLPDLFAGYRYEKPYGAFTFRVGLTNYVDLFGLGIGFKF
jgi:hypothetical protein